MRLSEWIRDRFWFIPLLLVLGGVVTAVVVAHPDIVGLPPNWRLGGTVRTSTADTMLSVMSASMLTFVGVVFAITLVGLQLASSQLSPRVIRTFVRSGVTKVAFGFFLATFAFAVTGLAMDEVEDPSAAARTVAVSVAMLAGAVVIFVIYVTVTMRLLEVGWVITAVADEARAAIRRGYPQAEAYVEADPPALVAHPHVVHLSSRDTRSYKGVLGTVLGVDRPRLVRLATDCDCVIDRLHDLLLRIARLPTPTGLHVDATGTVRLVEPTYSWRYLLDLAFVEVTALGISSPHVTRRLAAALRDLQADVPPEAAPEVARVQEALDDLLREHVTVAFAGLARTPDRLGLG